jgi:uroporphyrin-III C-methyltransferase / precorrin-2 dehydrogenase / sirohydrochlorin ferrochelatase
MRFLPIFLDLRSGPVLLVGAGEPARARLRLLVAAGARVRWHAIDGNYDGSTTGVANDAFERSDADPLTSDLSVIAVLCAGAGDIGRAVAARARALGLPVNVMDEVEHSTFIVPAIVDRGDVVVAIGSGGLAPVLARRLRERIEVALPARIGELAAFIGRWRAAIGARFVDLPQRRRFWEGVVDGSIGAAVLTGRGDEAERALQALTDPSRDLEAKPDGFVTLVGAGPGDPDLLTIKALRALQDADVIFHDELVSAEVLDRARRDAKRVAIGRRAGKPGIGQEAISQLLIEAARDGQRVVRLKGGDPFVFGRGGEEVDALRAAGVAYAVVPGITAGLGAAAQFDVPLTLRDRALQVTLLTAHKAEDAQAIDWSALTDTKTTVLVYMGVAAAPAISAGLLAAGRAPTTPVGVFARVTQPDARAVIGVLTDLPALAAQVESGPATLIIGDVVARSTPWQTSHLTQFLSNLGIAAE